MSLNRLNTLLMSGILPFNFGMTYDGWVELYQNINHRDLVGSDPATWSQEVRDQIEQRAKEETELCNRLMKLSNEEFYAEVERLREESE